MNHLVWFFLLVPFDVNWNLCQNRFEIRPIWEYHEYNSKCYAHTQCVYYVSLNRNPHQSINKTSLTHSHSSSAECRALFLFIVCLVGVFFVESSPFVRSFVRCCSQHPQLYHFVWWIWLYVRSKNVVQYCA